MNVGVLTVYPLGSHAEHGSNHSSKAERDEKHLCLAASVRSCVNHRGVLLQEGRIFSRGAYSE